METKNKTAITIEANVNAPVEKVWEYWNNPEHITKWNSASPDWHTPSASSDLKAGGRFTARMEAKDGSMGFDFGGVFNAFDKHQYIEYTMDDDRKVWIWFTKEGDKTHIKEVFEAEDSNSLEMQQYGWQAILDSFKAYAESNPAV